MNIRVSIETAYTLRWKWKVLVWKFRKKEIPLKQKNNMWGESWNLLKYCLSFGGGLEGFN